MSPCSGISSTESLNKDLSASRQSTTSSPFQIARFSYPVPPPLGPNPFSAATSKVSDPSITQATTHEATSNAAHPTELPSASNNKSGVFMGGLDKPSSPVRSAVTPADLNTFPRIPPTCPGINWTNDALRDSPSPPPPYQYAYVMSMSPTAGSPRKKKKSASSIDATVSVGVIEALAHGYIEGDSEGSCGASYAMSTISGASEFRNTPAPVANDRQRQELLQLSDRDQKISPNVGDRIRLEGGSRNPSVEDVVKIPGTCVDETQETGVSLRANSMEVGEEVLGERGIEKESVGSEGGTDTPNVVKAPGNEAVTRGHSASVVRECVKRPPGLTISMPHQPSGAGTPMRSPSPLPRLARVRSLNSPDGVQGQGHRESQGRKGSRQSRDSLDPQALQLYPRPIPTPTDFQVHERSYCDRMKKKPKPSSAPQGARAFQVPRITMELHCPDTPNYLQLSESPSYLDFADERSNNLPIPRTPDFEIPVSPETVLSAVPQSCHCPTGPASQRTSGWPGWGPGAERGPRETRLTTWR